jgi:hypothetical protein
MGSSVCFACDENSIPNDQKTTCLCDIGFAAEYVYNNVTLQTETTCRECPDGAVCDFRGAEWDTMEAALGYWQGEDDTFYRCLLAAHCIGGDEDGDTQCAANRTGPICAQCQDGYSEDSFDGSCQPCEVGSAAYTFTAIVCVAVIAIFYIQYNFVLWTSGPLLDAAHIEDELAANTGDYVLDDKAYKTVRQLRYGQFLTVDGPPAPKPEPLYKLKILLTFLQILTNISLSLEIDYPDVYVSFVNYFNPANLDFVQFTDAECVATFVNEFFSFYMWLAFPLFIVSILFFGFYLPVACKGKKNDPNVKRRRRELWRLIMFTLFLCYPSVSSSIFSMFVCTEVVGVRYLTADFSLLCSGPEYDQVMQFAIPAILVYPLGIPLFIYKMLKGYRYSKVKTSKSEDGKKETFAYKNRLSEKGIRAQLGFLYDCYNGGKWYFEIVDMGHKLIATSLIAFFPWQVQLPMGMMFLMGYLAILLCMNPYIRKGDDMLHLVAQTELILILMAGNCVESAEVVDATLDWILSIVLIAMILLFCVWWASSMWNVLKKWSQGSNSGFAKKLRKCCRIKDEQKVRQLKANGIIGPSFLLNRDEVTTQMQRINFLAQGKHVTFQSDKAATKKPKKLGKHNRSASSNKLTELFNEYGADDIESNDAAK